MCFYELHYRGFADVSDGYEWDTDLLQVRGALEGALLGALNAVVDPPDCVAHAEDLPGLLFEMTQPRAGRSLSTYLASKATDEQFREFLIHRCAYHLKEADPYTWQFLAWRQTPKPRWSRYKLTSTAAVNASECTRSSSVRRSEGLA